MVDTYFLFFPRRTCECDEVLKKKGLLAPEKVGFINMNIIPYEEDLLSLEVNDSFYQSFKHEDLEFSSQTYDAITRIEKVYGVIKYKFAKGRNSYKILDKLIKDHM